MWTLALVLAAALASSSPAPVSVPTGSTGDVDLGPAAGLAQALGGSSHGHMNRVALQQASARAADGASVSGAEGQGRSVVSIADVDDDGRADLLDLRAADKTLTVTGVSGRNGAALWTRSFTGSATIFGAAFPAAIAEAGDAYLIVQWAHDGFLTWAVHAINGASGESRWTQSGQLLSGLPPVSTSPSIPPSIPALPSVPAVPALPTAVPTALPTTLPTEAPTAVPTTLPTGLPVPPLGVPSALPTTLPTTVPSAAPTTLPTPPASVPALPTIPSMAPPGAPSSNGGRMGPASQSNEAEEEAPILPATLEAFTIGLRPADVDGDQLLDFPLVAIETGTGPDNVPVMASTLVTLSAAGGSPVGVIAGVGRGAAPYVGVAGDMTSDGIADLVASNEVLEPAASVSATTWLAAANNGRPLWVGADRFDLGSVSVLDASTDVTGDGAADLVIHRLPETGSGRNAILAVRAGVNGVEAWRTELPEASVVTVGPRLDDDAAADIITQSIVGASPDAIPTKLAYRALSGVDGAEIYVSDYAFPCAGCAGAWTATLTGDAGDLDGDESNDLTHTIGAYPSSLQSASSQAGVNVRTGEALWTLECVCAPSTPVQANLAAGPGQDLIEAKEVVTRLTDAISLRAASGTDAASLWQTSVVVGGGNDRIRSISLMPADLTGQGTADVLITAVQKSGSVWRSVVIAVRGSTGRVIWIRTR